MARPTDRDAKEFISSCEIAPSAAFTPPSVDQDKILTGRSYIHHSPLPIECVSSSTPCILGVDEAGRGPVLGPMVYAVAYIPIKLQELLKKHKFDDSKKLTASIRSSLLNTACTKDSELYNAMGWSTSIMSPQDISSGMLRATATGAYNLNAQAHDTTAQLIREIISRGINVTEIYVDTVGVAENYQAKLAKQFPGASVTVTKKADSLFPVVSAASVCAKVTRDAAIAVSAKHYAKGHRELGSGYPGDEKTKQWLRGHLDNFFGWDGIVTRFSWRTAKDMLEGKDPNSSEAEWPNDVDGTESAIANFFSDMDQRALNTWYGESVQSGFI